MAKKLKQVTLADGRTLNLATDWRRILGFLLDSLVLAIPVNLLVAITSPSIKWIVSTLTYVVYVTFMIAKTGTTLGGKAMKVRAANATTGARLTLAESFKRALLFWVTVLPLDIASLWSNSRLAASHNVGDVLSSTAQTIPVFLATSLLWLISVLWIDISKKKQTWYDIWAKTVVIDASGEV